MLLLGLLALGMLIGWLAQIVLGMGTRPNAQSLVAGIVGSFVGGLAFSLIAGDGIRLRPSGLIGSFIGAIVVLLIWRAVSSRRS
ncbi:MAG TPA: GlsB/YeaQ/YmgE family stress response membrane protein [Acidimicrobiales bacterium]